jgi:hypothetical protein
MSVMALVLGWVVLATGFPTPSSVFHDLSDSMPDFLPGTSAFHQSISGNTIKLSGAVPGIKLSDVHVTTHGTQLEVKVDARHPKSHMMRLEDESFSFPRELLPNTTTKRLKGDQLIVTASMAPKTSAPAKVHESFSEHIETSSSTSPTNSSDMSQFATAEKGFEHNFLRAEKDMKSSFGSLFDGMLERPTTPARGRSGEDHKNKMAQMKQQLQTQAAQIKALKQSQMKAEGAFKSMSKRESTVERKVRNRAKQRLGVSPQHAGEVELSSSTIAPGNVKATYRNPFG